MIQIPKLDKLIPSELKIAGHMAECGDCQILVKIISKHARVSVKDLSNISPLESAKISKHIAFCLYCKTTADQIIEHSKVDKKVLEDAAKGAGHG